MIKDIHIASYKESTFPFRRQVCSLLGTTRLEELHLSCSPREILDRISELRATCEAVFDETWATLNEFIHTEIEPKCGRLLARQKHATFRFHLARSESSHNTQDQLLKDHQYDVLLNRFYDQSRTRTFHRDGDYNVDHRAINLWIPLTELCDANALWIGGRHAKGADALPCKLKQDEYLLFDAVSRWHGTILNSSKITRVSFDIRLVFDHESALVRSLRDK